MSNYGIFKNKKGKTLVYYPCPKNANSSAKLFFAQHLDLANNFIFVSDEVPRYKQEKKHFGNKQNLVNFLPTKQPFKKIDADIRCCILRDPIDRFVSSYKNRILYHHDQEFSEHTVDMVIEKLEINNFENKHFLPQSFFLGKSLSYYDFYVDIKNISKFESYINTFFEKKIGFPKIQTGGKNYKILLNKDQIKKIKKIYFEDFDLLKQVKNSN
jgi:hypothetical protein